MIIDRYITRAVLGGCLAAAFIMLAIFAFVDFVGQMDYVGKGDYGVLQAIMFVLMRLPQRLYDLSPSILLLGSIISMGAMASNSELIVMRASGLSAMRITRSVLQAGFLVAIIVALVGEYLAPVATRSAKSFRAESMEEKLIIGGSNDLWARDGNRYVNVGQIMPDQQLRDINVYETEDGTRLSQVIHAESAKYQENGWQLNQIQGSRFLDQRVETFFHKTLFMKRLILLEVFSILELNEADMSATELWRYSRYLADNKLDNGKYMLAFWIKVFTPFTCLAMLLIAMPVVFSTTPRSGGIGQRVIIAIIIGVVYFVINRSVNNLGLALNIDPFISAVFPLIVVVSLSLFLIRRVT